MSGQQQSFVKIKNHNNFDIEDKYDGRLVRIPSKGSIDVPFHVAAHLLGVMTLEELMNKSFKTYICQRWGWNRPEIEKDDSHLRFANNISAELVTYKMVSADEEQDGLPKSRKGKAAKELETEVEETEDE